MTDKSSIPYENSSHTASQSHWASVATDVVTVLLSATLLALPIEDGRFWPVAFVALVPLLLRMWTRSYWAIFFFAFAAFFLYYFHALRWLDSYGLHWRIALVFMNATAYAAAFVLAFWILRRYRSHFFATVLPTILVLMDFKQTLGFLGFPWPILCHSQSSNLPFIQIASITGCWGVTFILVHVNEALAHLIAGGFRTRVLPIAVAPAVLIVASGLYGAVTLAQGFPEPDIQTTLVQWDEATNVEWSSEFNLRAIDAYTRLTMKQLSTASAGTGEASDASRMVIWPETSIPDALMRQETLNGIRWLAGSSGATFLVGCLTWDPPDGKPIDLDTHWRRRDEYREYNSLVAFEPDGSVIPVYSKTHLVAFGEVIPLRKLVTGWFPEYPWGGDDITPGTGYHVASTGIGKVGSVVCYESFFPQIARRLVTNGAEILVLVSNTSWFGPTQASRQHARFDAYRAVENGIWFCRAATTGVSSVIDPQGRTVVATDLFKAEAVTVPVGLRSGTTLYTRLGDWVPALCGAYLLILLLGIFLIREEDTTAV